MNHRDATPRQRCVLPASRRTIENEREEPFAHGGEHARIDCSTVATHVGPGEQTGSFLQTAVRGKKRLLSPVGRADAKLITIAATRPRTSRGDSLEELVDDQRWTRAISGRAGVKLKWQDRLNFYLALFLAPSLSPLLPRLYISLLLSFIPATESLPFSLSLDEPSLTVHARIYCVPAANRRLTIAWSPL